MNGSADGRPVFTMGVYCSFIVVSIGRTAAHCNIRVCGRGHGVCR